MIQAGKEFSERLPLVIGVTGHRDLRPQDIGALEAAVDTVFERITREWLHGGDTPIVLLSSLAEGADQLVARAALRHGATLIAPLPMAAEDYRRDFEQGLSPGAADRFDALMAQATAAPVVSSSSQADRNERYRAAGMFIAKYSHILIALWDGDAQNPKVGGTAEIVAHFREGTPLYATGSARSSLGLPKKGPVIHIVAPRSSAPASNRVETRPWGVTSKSPDDDQNEWNVLAATLLLTTQFNHESKKFSQHDSTAKKKESLDQLFEDSTTKEVLVEAKSRAVAEAPHWCALYALADLLARDSQRRFRRDWGLLFGVGFGAFICFELFHVLHQPRLIAVYVLLLFVTAVILVYVRSQRHQERFMIFRALAEAQRVGVFWKLIGTDKSPADAYPIEQHSELAWVRLCLRSLELLDLLVSPLRLPPVSDLQKLNWIYATWINGQKNYFGREARRLKRIAFQLKCISLVLLASSPSVVIFWLVFDTWQGGISAWSWHAWEGRSWWIFACAALPALAAVVAGYGEQLAFDARAHQYERMHWLFTHAHDLMFDASGKSLISDDGFALIRELYIELGVEAMQESAQWFALYRQRPIRLPNG
jgi:hypothetical protein